MSYQTWVKVQQTIESPLDRIGPHWKYVLSAYLYFRSRLFVPGRAYDSEEHGMLSIGGTAHCEVMDLDVKLSRMSKQAQRDACDWMLGTSQERIAEWRKMGRGESQSSISRRRSRLIEDLESDGNYVTA